MYVLLLSLAWPWSCTDPSRGPLSRSPPRPPRKAVKPTRHTSSRQPLDVGANHCEHAELRVATRNVHMGLGGRALAYAPRTRTRKNPKGETRPHTDCRKPRCLLVLLLCLSTLSRRPTTHGQTQLEQLSLPIIHAKQPSFLCPLHPILLPTLLPIA